MTITPLTTSDDTSTTPMVSSSNRPTTPDGRSIHRHSYDSESQVTSTDTRPTRRHSSVHDDGSICAIQNDGELDDIAWWSSLPLRNWETQRFGQLSSGTAERTQTLHLLLIRHAESGNNALTDQMMDTKEQIAAALQNEQLNHTHADNGHAHHNNTAAIAPSKSQHDLLMDAYNKKRTSDPDLSKLGYKQANVLPNHPYLCDLKLWQLNTEERITIISSPMRRAMLTSRPLLKSLNRKATVLPLFCERGGCYSAKQNDTDGSYVNVSDAGRSRSAMEAEFSDTHDCSNVSEEGFWIDHCKLSPYMEDDDLFYPRLERVVAYLKECAKQYAISYRQHTLWLEEQERMKQQQNPSCEYTAQQSPHLRPDFLLAICHADLIDELLSRLLGCTARRYVFYTTNTAIAHVELLYMPHDKLECRIRGTNIQPVKISSSVDEGIVSDLTMTPSSHQRRPSVTLPPVKQ